jgi:hypothetical protein
MAEVHDATSLDDEGNVKAIWRAGDLHRPQGVVPPNPSVLNREAFRGIADEARRAMLKTPYHVYARLSTYSGPNIEFYQIPDRILDKLGFNAATESYGSDGQENA